MNGDPQNITNKEYLTRIDAKLDALAGRMTAMELKGALLEQRVSHFDKEEEETQGRVAKLESKFNSVLAGVGTGVFAAVIFFFQNMRG